MNKESLAILTMCSDIALRNPKFRPFSSKKFNEISSQIKKYVGINALLYLLEEDLSSMRLDAFDIERIVGLRREGIEEAIETYREELGIRVISSADEMYPAGLKSIANHPQILYAKGNMDLLSAEDVVSIVGTRQPDLEEEKFTIDAAKIAAQNKFTVATGGALGVDSLAACSAQNSGGNSIIFVPFGLSSIGARRLESYICERDLLLCVCSVNKNFSRTRALERNAYIYALGKFAVVIGSRIEKGGSWSGATDALKYSKTIYAFSHGEGNAALISLGARGVANAEEIGYDLRRPTF